MKQTGHAFIAMAAVWFAYLVIAFTLAADYQEALVEAAEDLGVSDNKLPAEAIAQVFEQHTAGSLVGLPILFAAPAIMLMTAFAVRKHWPSAFATWSVRTAVVSAAIWWAYLLIDSGSYLGPDNLPPLTRDIDVLTVPLVAAASAFALVSVIAAAEGLRKAGVVRRAARIASALAAFLLVAGLAGTFTSGFEDPLPPIALFPSSLILGIALLRSARKEQPPAARLFIPVGQRED